MFIDADTHIDECEDTWSYIPEDSAEYRPCTVGLMEKEVPSWFNAGSRSDSNHSRQWLIDGQAYPRRYRSDEKTGTTLATRELYDVPARLADMDELSVQYHVLYPTLFLNELSLRPEVSAALAHSYNAWLADRCKLSNGRLQWVAMIPMVSMPDALKELEFAKNNGAVGLFKRGVECRGLTASDPYFYPIYDLAAQYDLPICLHKGPAWRPVNVHLTPFRLPYDFEVLQAFQALALDRTPARFPGLKFGFIEVAAEWVPYLLKRSDAKSLEELHFYVTCEEKEDVGYLVKQLGYENLMVGTDYSHADLSAVRDSHEKIANRTDIDDDAIRYITAETARNFYNLP